MSSLLDDLRLQQHTKAKQLVDYEKTISECPPVSKALIQYIERMFSRKLILPTSPSMQQELVYQAGIDKVIAHLRSQNDKQERTLRESHVKKSTGA